MRKALKGALLSGLVWPGLGQVVMKRYARGGALMAATLAALVLFMVKAVQFALGLLEKLQSAATMEDIQAASQKAVQSMAAMDQSVFNIALTVIVVFWLVGIVDAWRLGARLDRETAAHRPAAPAPNENDGRP